MNHVPHIESPRSGRPRRAARLVLAVVTLFATVPLMAQQTRVYREGRSWVEESSGTLAPSRNLKVASDAGSIRVQGGAPAIRWVIKKRSYANSEAEARKQFDRFRINVNKTADTAVIDTRATAHNSTDVSVEIPREMELIDLDTMGGGLSVVGTNARLELSTKGGSITADDIGGSIKAQTLGGNINIGTARGDVYVRSGGGNIELSSAAGKVDVNTMGGNVMIGNMGTGTVQTGGGSIAVRRSGGDLNVNTVGGTIDVGEVIGKAVLQTGGGNIRLGVGKGRVVANSAGGNIELWKLSQGAQAQTGAGAITAEFIGGRGSFGDSMLRTAAGDVVVYLGGATGCTIHAASELASGKGIRSEFPELKITSEGGDFGPRTMFAEGAINGGGPLLKVRTTIGQIEFRRVR